jgi:hypothetical protein
MGHEPIATTNLYLHFLGTGAHRAGLNLLNRPLGAAGGHLATPPASYSSDPHLVRASFALVRTGISVGAACRNRTDDLFITSESLYRLS